MTRLDAHYVSTTPSENEQQRVRDTPNYIAQEPADRGRIQQCSASARVPATATRSPAVCLSAPASLPDMVASMSELATAVHTGPDVRRRKVAALREAVERWVYPMSPARIADSMLSQATSKLR